LGKDKTPGRDADDHRLSGLDPGKIVIPETSSRRCVNRSTAFRQRDRNAPNSLSGGGRDERRAVPATANLNNGFRRTADGQP
jgi:hypothetical protein